MVDNQKINFQTYFSDLFDKKLRKVKKIFLYLVNSENEYCVLFDSGREI